VARLSDYAIVFNCSSAVQCEFVIISGLHQHSEGRQTVGKQSAECILDEEPNLKISSDRVIGYCKSVICENS
jgi:hypothetical protein